jgi:SAM-dependent methyltransferase
MRYFWKHLIKQGLQYFGYEVRRRDHKYGQDDPRAQGFISYLNQARQAGQDVNDWEEQVLGWVPALSILEQTTLPYLMPNATVCELGPGTGRFARYWVRQPEVADLYLVDYAPWIVNFLREYFTAYPHVHVEQNNGYSLPFEQAGWCDLIFSNGCFIAFKLSLFYLYSREFFRVLKPGGYCVFDYIDIETPEGWQHLETQSPHFGDCYAYHHPEVVKRVFSQAGFEIMNRYQIGKSIYLVTRKPI